VQKAWRNTTQPNCGLSSFYDKFFPLVRRINRTLPPNKKLRVLACDPPINWSKVKSAKDMKPFVNRDSSIASVMEREVLAKHRNALMIFGASHLVHGEGSAVAMYENAGHPNVTLTVLAHNGFGNHTPLAKYNDQLEDRMASWPRPSLVTIKNTWLGNLDSRYVLPQDEGGPLATKADAYLYLGPRSSLVNEPRPTRALSDKEYLAELRRRADISAPRPREKSHNGAKKQTKR
jgi:hypothetical protein